MRLIKLGLAALDPTVGAVTSNTDALIEAARSLADQQVTVACFPEQAIGGYPPEDLVQWRGFVEAQRAQLERLARETGELATVLVVGAVVGVGGQLFNVAAVIHRGEILGFVPKERLPTYEVFYEARTFSQGSPGLLLDADGVPLGDQLFELDIGTLAVEVCEDLWTPEGPMRRRCLDGAELVVNLSASPYRIGVHDSRREMIATRSADNQATVVYCNRVGGQDGLVFDGGGMVFQNGRPLLEAPRFETGAWTCVVDLDRTTRLRHENTTWRREQQDHQAGADTLPRVQAPGPTPPTDALAYPAPPASGTPFLPSHQLPERTPRQRMLDDLHEALSLGVADYVTKTGAFQGIGVALSGGRDSLLTLLVAHRALERLHDRGQEDLWLEAHYMPSRHSGQATAEAARTICRELGVELTEVSIEAAYQRELEAAGEMLGGEAPTEVTRENVQARIRGTRMWNWANTSGGLFLQSGDMSERAVGYTTVAGDLEGAFSPIANLPKTVVVALLERLHQRFGYAGIEATLATEAGPELADGQAAEAELMPFEVLDACIHLFAVEKLSPGEATRALTSLFPDEAPDQLASWVRTFVRRFTASIHKWVRAPLSLHVGRVDLDRERALQLPVVQSTEWFDDEA